MVCSTTGDGVPPTDSRPFHDWVHQSDLDLSHLSFSVLALGDTAYPYFCRAGLAFSERFQKLNASMVVPTQTVDLVFLLSLLLSLTFSSQLYLADDALCLRG